jgi:hypothetical protein
MSQADDFSEVHKRTVAESTLVARQAIALVRPVNEKIGAWQTESIRLSTSAQRMRASGRSDPGITEAITTLLGYVEEQSRRFDDDVAAQPAAIVRHSRIADTRQALAMVAERLRDAAGGR